MTPRRSSFLMLACLLALATGSTLAQSLRVAPRLGGTAGAAANLPLPQRVPAGPQQADFIVAVVNSEPITNQDVQSMVRRFEKQVAGRGNLPPRAQLTAQALERLINDKAQLQLARETGVRVDEGQIDQAEQNVAAQNQMSVPDLQRRLASEGVARAQFRDELRNQLLLVRLREREVEPRVRVSDQDIDQFLQEQPAESGPGSEINLAQVLVAVPERASEAQVASLLARAQKVQARARAGEDFTALVREFSDARDRASNGGQFGLRPADRYPGLFVEATRELPVGGVSAVLRSGAGFHILKVVERVSSQAPVTVTQSHARHILLRTSAQLNEAAARARLQDYKRRIDSGQADFASLARTHSQDGSAKEGGDLGWTNPGQFVPEFEEAMNALAPGQVSAPVVSRFGVHLIQLIERREQALSDRQRRELVRAQVRERKLEEAFATWAQEVRGRAYVEMREPPQ